MGTVYRIREWESRYEVNSKNRVWTDGDEKRAGALEYIRLPVSGHLLGKGFRRLNRVAGKNAPAVFGIFIKLLEIAGDNSRDLRGAICESDGKPMDVAAIAETLGWDESIIEKALNALCDKDLGWVECVEAPGLSRTFPEISGKSRSRSESESYTESETDTDTETETYCSSEPRNAPTEPTLQTPPSSIMEYPCAGKPNVWHLTQEFVDEYQSLYPGIDVMQECRAALGWLRANSGRRKTAKGMARFLVNWFNREQSKSRGAVQRPQKPSGPVHDDEEEFQREMQKVRDRILPLINKGNAS